MRPTSHSILSLFNVNPLYPHVVCSRRCSTSKQTATWSPGTSLPLLKLPSRRHPPASRGRAHSLKNVNGHCAGKSCSVVRAREGPGTHLTSLLAHCSCAFVCILHKRHTTKNWDNAENFFPFGRRKRKKIAEEERRKEVPRRRDTYWGRFSDQS